MTTTTAAQAGKAPKLGDDLRHVDQAAERRSVAEVEQLAVERRRAQVARQHHQVEHEHVEPDPGDRQRGGQLEAEAAGREPLPQEAHLRGDRPHDRRDHAAVHRARRRRTAAGAAGGARARRSQSLLARRRR